MNTDRRWVATAHVCLNPDEAPPDPQRSISAEQALQTVLGDEAVEAWGYKLDDNGQPSGPVLVEAEGELHETMEALKHNSGRVGDPVVSAFPDGDEVVMVTASGRVARVPM